ncbi:hypothetical protein [Natranaerobius thermophilus]|uniref:Transporter-associated domain-containing protein n=1 Tax=Natranaerobius thermophilus (strain ATCC BAA-1301 / DSM 18059 / JW/NM-WN-LF) TaxID=457570 RepID=B2A625_NATTJ|nr:hypothetical protein [Natranaerobius thermophilus]ACB85442.1 conserved hypothetical protein [Natranaerobius thermophilus JW/NM-WN-LF]
MFKNEELSKRINHYLVNTSEYVEKILALILILGVLGGIILLFQDLSNFGGDTPYDQFKNFVSYVLILVIALELCEMLLNRKPGTIIEIFFLAITRKLLVYSNETFELVLGAIALAGVFAIRKYLFIEDFEPADTVVVGGCTLVKDANTIAGVDILSHENQDITLNQLLHRIAKDEGRKLQQDSSFSIGGAEITVLEMYGNTVTRVKIKKLNNH